MVVGLAEIGDKTQILSMILAARFHRAIPIIFGIFFATIANHAAAGLVGTLFGSFLAGPWMRRILGISFLSVAVWALFPDKYEAADNSIGRWGAFTSTLIAFFLAEIGDKTQIATVGLAARFEHFLLVVGGTTLGMMLANIPAVMIGDRLAGKLPVKAIRIIAAIVFAGLGLLTVLGIGRQHRISAYASKSTPQSPAGGAPADRCLAHHLDDATALRSSAHHLRCDALFLRGIEASSRAGQKTSQSQDVLFYPLWPHPHRSVREGAGNGPQRFIEGSPDAGF